MSNAPFSHDARPPGRPSRRLRLAAAAIGLGCAAGFLGSALLAGFVGFVRSLERAEPTLIVQAQGVVALTGGADRVLDAAGLLARGQARRLLITGVNRATQGADIARLLPVSRELFACCVDLGYRGLDTQGNALETRDWMAERGLSGPLIVVTSNYHMPRALTELSAALPGVTLFPFPVISEHANVDDWPRDRRVLKLLAREYLKYLRAWLRTAPQRLFPTQPAP